MSWSFITTHGRVLVAIAAEPRRTLRQIAAEVGITERATHRVVVALDEAGYLERSRVGRRVHYRVDLPLLRRGDDERARVVRELIDVLAMAPDGGPVAEVPIGSGRP